MRTLNQGIITSPAVPVSLCSFRNPSSHRFLALSFAAPCNFISLVPDRQRQYTLLCINWCR